MRKLSGTWLWVVRALSAGLVLFQLYTTGFGLLSDIVQRSVHLAFVLTLLFILKPARKHKNLDKVPFYDIILALLSAASCIYLISIYDMVLYRPLQWLSSADRFFAVVLVALVLEASRRSVGWTFPVLGVTFLIYAYNGQLFPGMWGHPGFSFNLIFQTFYHTTNGVWGTMLGLSATMLAMFGIFGAILSGTGGAATFIKMGQAFTGNSIGGPAKVAVVASGLFGMVSGSAIGNVVATGIFTIPSMKKAGYSNEWAATVESVASTGGQIMPPIMGAAAFIMAQLIGVNYLYIATAAIVPALLYYLSCFLSVHLISIKQNIRGTSEKPKIAIGEYLVIVIPMIIFMSFLFNGYTVMFAAFYATFGAFFTYLIHFAVTTRNPKLVAKSTSTLCYDVTMNATTSIVEMCGILAGSQIAVTLISLTGFGVKISQALVAMGDGNLFMCLLLSMVVCIVLGMGLPTTAAYVLGAAVLAPALISLGLPPLIAHLFVLYFACLSAITPPVCVAVFMASGLAGAKWLQVGLLACLISVPAFVIPYTFCYNPALLLMGDFSTIVMAVVTAAIGVCLTNFAIVGYTIKPISFLPRLLAFAGGILMMIPDLTWSLLGLAIGGGALAPSLLKKSGPGTQG